MCIDKEVERKLPCFLQHFDMPVELKDDFMAMIRAVVGAEISKYKHYCRFDINDEEAKEVSHAMSVISSLGGDGKLGSGIEVIRDNHKWMKTQRDRSEKISMAFFLVLVTSVASGMCLALWLGIKSIILGK